MRSNILIIFFSIFGLVFESNVLAIQKKQEKNKKKKHEKHHDGGNSKGILHKKRKVNPDGKHVKFGHKNGKYKHKKFRKKHCIKGRCN